MPHPRQASVGEFEIGISSASNTSEVRGREDCDASPRQRVCGSNEIQVQLMSGTRNAFDFVHNKMCYDLDPNTTDVNVFNLEVNGEFCMKQMEVTPTTTGDIGGVLFPSCDTSEGCMDAITKGTSNETTSHYNCPGTNTSDIRAFEFIYDADSLNKHFRSDIDMIRDFSGNAMLISTLKLDLGMFSRLASSLKVHQLVYLGMKNEASGQRRSERLTTFTSTGTTLSESTSGIPSCSQSQIPGVSSHPTTDELQFFCTTPSCNGYLDVQPPSFYNNFEMQVQCIPSAVDQQTPTTTPSTSSPSSDWKLIITILVAASAVVGVAVIAIVFYFMYWRKPSPPVSIIAEKSSFPFP